jgi:HlyD family secretion protein
MRTPVYAVLSLLAAGCGSGADDPFQARGTVEMPEVDLAVLSGARVIAVRVEEGALVQAGDTLALLTQSELGATLAAERARIGSALATLRDLEAGSRPEEIARAEAELSSARAEVDRTAKDLTRTRDLVSRDLMSRESLDHAVSAEQVARGRMQAAEEALRLLRAGSRRERIAGARSDVAQARASLAQVEARAGDLVLIAPVRGIVLSRNAEPGEALAAGVPVLTLGESGKPYVRVYFPQSVAGGLRTGAEAVVLDGQGRTLPGRVVAINPRAEFTPLVALTEEERADLMFGVKVEFTDPSQAPHPGLWVTVRLPVATSTTGVR